MNEQDQHRDPALSRLLHAAAPDEPPSRLDAAILAAARQEVAPKRAVRRWWQRFQAPLALAATVTLAIALSFTMDRHPPQLEHAPAAAKTDAPVPLERKMADATAAQENRPAAKAEVAKAAATPPTASPAAPPPAPSPARMPHPPAVTADSAQQATPSTAEAAASAPEQRGNLGAAADGGLAGAPAMETRRQLAAPAAKATAKVRQEGFATRTPEAWLESIRALRRQGRQEEAARQFAEFRRTYPDYPLPEDFR